MIRTMLARLLIFMVILAPLPDANSGKLMQIAQPNLPSPKSDGTLRTSTSLDQTLESIRHKFGLPALAAAVVRSNRIIAVGAVGLRKEGSSTAVTVEDKFHIGSCTKSMTATLAAMLVEERLISWETTLAETFPEWKQRMHSRYQPQSGGDWASWHSPLFDL